MKHSSLLTTHPPEPPLATFIIAHGAGAPMDSDWMNRMTNLLLHNKIRVIRFEFPYMSCRRENGVRRPPDPPAVLSDCWRSVIDSVRYRPLAIGGKSMGGRIAAMVANEFHILGTICLGYPLRPMGKGISDQRLQCLRDISGPTLILQGERDSLGNFQDLSNCTLSPTVQIKCIPSGDHSFKPLKKSGRTLEQNIELAAETIVNFIKRCL